MLKVELSTGKARAAFPERRPRQGSLLTTPTPRHLLRHVDGRFTTDLHSSISTLSLSLYYNIISAALVLPSNSP
jgi:hypothetical protein